MVVRLRRLFERNRIGITIRRLRSFSVSRLEESLDAVRAELDSPLVGIKKRVIQEFDYVKRRNEYRMSSIIDVPIRVKELIIEKGELEVRERVEYLARNIGAVIRLEIPNVIFFSQTLREVQRFSKYLKEITLGGFQPAPAKFNQEELREITDAFNAVHHLKLSKGTEENIESITFRGNDLLTDDLVSGILSDPTYGILEVGGHLPLSSGNVVKSYLSYRGRMMVWSDPQAITDDDLNDLTEKIEKMREE